MVISITVTVNLNHTASNVLSPLLDIVLAIVIV